VPEDDTGPMNFGVTPRTERGHQFGTDLPGNDDGSLVSSRSVIHTEEESPRSLHSSKAVSDQRS